MWSLIVIFVAGSLLGLFVGVGFVWALVRGRVAIFIGCPTCQQRHQHNRMVLERARRERVNPECE